MSSVAVEQPAPAPVGFNTTVAGTGTTRTHVIRRAKAFAVENDFFVKSKRSNDKLDFFRGERRTFSPPLSSGGVKRGIPFEQEKNIPAFISLVNSSSDHASNWDRAVQNFWLEYQVKIPFGRILKNSVIEDALDLNASYYVENGLIYPENINNYILYNYLKEDPKTCKDIAQYKERESYDFFMIDAGEEQKRREEAVEVDMKALEVLFKLQKDEESTGKMQLILSIVKESGILALRATRMTRTECLESILQLSRKYPEKFVAASETKNLAERAFIMQLTEASLINKEGKEYYYENNLIGELKSMINWTKSPDNVVIVSKLKSKLEAYQTIGSDLDVEL